MLLKLALVARMLSCTDSKALCIAPLRPPGDPASTKSERNFDFLPRPGEVEILIRRCARGNGSAEAAFLLFGGLRTGLRLSRENKAGWFSLSSWKGFALDSMSRSARSGGALALTRRESRSRGTPSLIELCVAPKSSEGCDGSRAVADSALRTRTGVDGPISRFVRLLNSSKLSGRSRLPIGTGASMESIRPLAISLA
eukprot:3331412-Rhodomonas_salina.6